MEVSSAHIDYISLKLRLYPTQEQKTYFNKCFGSTRFIYNYYLAERNQFYNDKIKGIEDKNKRNDIYETSQATNHAPSYGWIQLIVIQMNNSSSFCNQIAFRDDTIYIRKCGNDIWSDWKQISDDLTSGTLTIPAQTLANGDYAEIQIPLVPGDFYCGRIDFADLPSQNMSLSYNDFSGSFQDTRSTEQRSQYVLYPIGKANLATLHVYLTNYTGSPVTISDINVIYYLEHHKAQ